MKILANSQTNYQPRFHTDAGEVIPTCIAIVQLRRVLGNLTRGQLAIRLGVSPFTVRSWELGISEPKPETLR